MDEKNNSRMNSRDITTSTGTLMQQKGGRQTLKFRILGSYCIRNREFDHVDKVDKGFDRLLYPGAILNFRA